MGIFIDTMEGSMSGNLVKVFALAIAPLFFAQASIAQVSLKYMEGKTDSTGRFTIQHDYLATPSSCEGDFIAGATVAIQSKGNKEWYVVSDRNTNLRAISWTDKKIGGYFGQPDFVNQPVRVVLFITSKLC